MLWMEDQVAAFQEGRLEASWRAVLRDRRARNEGGCLLAVSAADVFCVCSTSTAAICEDYDEQPQTWLPLFFDEQGGVLPMQYVDTFTLDVAV